MNEAKMTMEKCELYVNSIYRCIDYCGKLSDN